VSNLLAGGAKAGEARPPGQRQGDSSIRGRFVRLADGSAEHFIAIFLILGAMSS